MSRTLAGAVLVLMFAGSTDTALRAMRNEPQPSYAAKKSPEAIATEAFNKAVERLARREYEAALKDLEAVKESYMHLFVHDRTASHVLMKEMKTWADKRRTQPAGEPAAIEAFAAWVRERDTLAASVGNLGHNSPDWK